MNKSLFSQHYLEHRLPNEAEWSENARPVFDAVAALWRKAQRLGHTWNEAQTEQELIQPVLRLLGWSYIVQPKLARGGQLSRPDYILFADQASKDAAQHAGGDEMYRRATAIGEAKRWGRALSKMEGGGRDAWKAGANPSHQMVSYLYGSNVQWGILTNGQLWRLYHREVSSVASEYYEVDLGAIFDGAGEDGAPTAERLDAFRRWWLFFRRDSFVAGADPKPFVLRVHEGSATYARQVSDQLKDIVFQDVMPVIAGGFVRHRRQVLGIAAEDEASLRQVYQASLSLLYKLLFLLYAEARHLLPMRNEGYREQSLTEMARWAAERRDRRAPLSDNPAITPKYDAVLALCDRIDQGDPSLDVPRYDGGLFDPTSVENRFLRSHKLSDAAVAEAVDLLVRDKGQPVDYAYISVRNLGAIYEGLLENKLALLPPEEHDPAAPDKTVALVNDKGERRASGSYYTPDYIVEYIVRQTLEPVLEQRGALFAAAMEEVIKKRRALLHAANPATNQLLQEQLAAHERAAREAFLGIKVCDPAMGSGHFLVNAVDSLTDGIIRRMQEYHDGRPDVEAGWNPLYALMQRVRGEILEEMGRQGIAVDERQLDDTALLTRLVMKRCVYGVDLNPMAVELAKLSLWLHSFTVGAPLSFLDHHLRWGNSLIGTDVRTVEHGLTAQKQQGLLFGGPFAGLLDLTDIMVQVVERSDATLGDVEESARLYAEFQRQLLPYKQALDLWVSQYFGNARALEFLDLYRNEVLPTLRDGLEVAPAHQEAIDRAKALWQEKRFFHWDLEFPEVFIDLEKRDWAENPGFDAVIGNPPYVRSIRLKEADQNAWQYYRNTYEVARRGEFDIYLCFIEQGKALLNDSALLGMIVPNKWFTSRVGSRLRSLLTSTQSLNEIVDFGSFQVFSGVTTYTCLV